MASLLTSLDTAVALASSLESGYSERNISLVDMNHQRQTTPVTPGQEEFPLFRGKHPTFLYQKEA